MRSRAKVSGLALALITALVVAACGSSGSSSTSSTATTSSTASTSTSAATTSAAAGSSGGAVASVTKLVPAAIKQKGTITVAADATYAPDEFIASNGHTVIGMDADLTDALAATMGLKATLVNVTFDDIIPGMVAGRYQMGASSFTDTKAREKQVDFVDYANVGESFYTKSHGGTTISSIDDICGMNVSVEQGTTEEADAKTQSGKCTSAGKKGVNVMVFPNQNLANLAVSSGRAQLGFADTPVAAYQVKKSHGAFKLVGAEYAPAPYGLAIAKSSGLTKAVQAALIHLINDGTYTKIFDKWNVQSIAIPASKVKIDGATS